MIIEIMKIKVEDESLMVEHKVDCLGSPKKGEIKEIKQRLFDAIAAHINKEDKLHTHWMVPGDDEEMGDEVSVYYEF